MQNIEVLMSGLEVEVALLTAEIDVLKIKIDSLTAEHTSLVDSLTAELTALREKNAKLKEKLSLTSKNSSIPSSRELYKLKRKQAKSLRSIGGQPGHPGTTRGKIVADEVIDLPISEVCQCEGHVVVSFKPYIT